MLLRDEEATVEDMRRHAQEKASQVQPGGTLWFIFIGRGAPSPDGKDELLMGIDAQQRAENLSIRSLSLGEILGMLAKGRQAKALVLVDAGFPERKDLQHLALPPGSDKRMVLLTADKTMPTFSYLALGALRGWAADSQGKVTAARLVDFANHALNPAKDGARTSELAAGAPDTILGVGREKAPDLAQGGAQAVDFQISALPESNAPSREKRARMRDQDWDKLSRLLELSAVSAEDKGKFAAAFVKAYGQTLEDNPYLPELVPVLPQGSLTMEAMKSLRDIQVSIPAGQSFWIRFSTGIPRTAAAGDILEGTLTLPVACDDSLDFLCMPAHSRIRGEVLEASTLAEGTKVLRLRFFKALLAGGHVLPLFAHITDAADDQSLIQLGPGGALVIWEPAVADPKQRENTPFLKAGARLRLELDEPAMITESHQFYMAGPGAWIKTQETATGQAFEVTRVIAGRCAEKEGLRAGDVLTSINGRPSAKLEFEDALAALYGTPGSLVKVVKAADKPRTLELKRGIAYDNGVETPISPPYLAAAKPAQTTGQAPGGKAEIEWVSIPGGSFLMGSGADDEAPVHDVAIKPFQMAKTLATVEQYKACVDAGACTPPVTGGYCNWGVAGRENHPINCVDWGQAQAFSSWAGGRIPSEAEWEYAARSAGKDWKYPWGNDTATCETAVISGCTGGGTAPVCSKPLGNTQQGLCDMAGNVWEWVQDWYHDSYNGAPTDGGVWESPAGSARVVRGGSWYLDASYARAAIRYNDAGPAYRYRFHVIGLRPVRSPRQEP